MIFLNTSLAVKSDTKAHNNVLDLHESYVRSRFRPSCSNSLQQSYNVLNNHDRDFTSDTVLAQNA